MTILPTIFKWEAHMCLSCRWIHSIRKLSTEANASTIPNVLPSNLLTSLEFIHVHKKKFLLNGQRLKTCCCVANMLLTCTNSIAIRDACQIASKSQLCVRHRFVSYTNKVVLSVYWLITCKVAYLRILITLTSSASTAWWSWYLTRHPQVPQRRKCTARLDNPLWPRPRWERCL